MPERLEDLPLVLTVPELCSTLRVSRGAGYDLVRTGAIESVRVGGRTIRIPRRALLRFLGEIESDEADA